jgi:hypothetical protein
MGHLGNRDRSRRRVVRLFPLGALKAVEGDPALMT